MALEWTLFFLFLDFIFEMDPRATSLVHFTSGFSLSWVSLRTHGGSFPCAWRIGQREDKEYN